MVLKMNYPNKAIGLLDTHFPKGNKDRGQVIAILGIAFGEGKKVQKYNDFVTFKKMLVEYPELKKKLNDLWKEIII